MKKIAEKALVLSAKMSEKLAVKSCGATSFFDTYQPEIPAAVMAMAKKSSAK